MMELLPNIGLADLDLFVRVAKLKSLRECARQLKMTPGAVSKSIKRLEKRVGKTLLRRSVSGILLSSDGHQLMVAAEKILQISTTLTTDGDKKSKQERVWGLGSLSFLSSRLLPQLLDPVCAARARTRFRIVEFTNNQLVAHGLNGAFEMAIHIGPLDWTRVWSSHELGKMRWCLYASAEHPLSQMKSVKSTDVTKYPFVMPTGWSTQGFVRGEDFCPAPWGERFAGHEATTGETALEIVNFTSNLTFVPAVLAQRSVDHGLVKEIKVTDWPVVERKIYLSVRDDLVSSSLLELMITQIRKKLAHLG
jgi:DNA-binding transcriptional LysR family regulator